MPRPDSRRATSRDDSFRAVFRPILLLAVTVFIDLLGFGIILPNLPQYIELAVGRDHRNAAFIGGLLGASYSFTQFLCAPFWGRYSDRVGRRPVILISLLGVAAAYVLFGIAGGRLWLLFAARLLAGFLSSASIGVAFAYVADVTTPDNRAKGIGLLGACFGLGFMMGPALGGWLGSVNLPLPAFVAAAMALANFAFSLRMLPESLAPEERERLARETRASAWTLVRRVLGSPAALLFVLTFIITFGFAAMEQIFSFYLLARGIATPQNQPRVTGSVMAFVGLVGILIQGGLIGRLVGRYGEGPVARIGMVILTAGYFLLPLPHALGPAFFGVTLLLSAGRSMIAPCLSALISRKAELGQGLVLSTSQSFDALARTVGPLVAGTLFQRIGPAMPYQFAGCLTLLALALTFAFRSTLSVGEASGG